MIRCDSIWKISRNRNGILSNCQPVALPNVSKSRSKLYELYVKCFIYFQSEFVPFYSCAFYKLFCVADRSRYCRIAQESFSIEQRRLHHSLTTPTCSSLLYFITMMQLSRQQQMIIYNSEYSIVHIRTYKRFSESIQAYYVGTYF